MNRALQLAALGLSSTAPNPMVGAVIVHKDTIIGEGYHRKHGEAHAEVNAVNSVSDLRLLEESTIYVTLEPCSHFGKTPPCADLIIKHNFKRVVICNTDPFEKVSGSGIKKLKEAGIEVEHGFLEKRGRHLNRRFFCFHEKKRPYIILKWAKSADDFIGKKNEQVWLTGSVSKQLVHQWRAEEKKQFQNIKYSKVDFEQDIPTQVGRICFKQNITSIIIEGGANTLQQFIDSNLWDEARVFSTRKKLESGIAAPNLTGVLEHSEKIEDDILTFFSNPNA